ncbi:hypothetical protein AKJ09_07342 [Labilithrix luteola]|uniref:Uncharacterized protein n=1 Tax=Labilithrix luteola TaxID=1391654 RepID=A0A0K1Q4L0_9BACT|nr:hypothetical protein AKJ09_07342 [Labilithrix luteola]
MPRHERFPFPSPLNDETHVYFTETTILSDSHLVRYSITSVERARVCDRDTASRAW